MLKEKISELIIRLRDEILTYYGNRLVALAIFGSSARETMRPNSDLDFLICAEDLPRGRRNRLKEFQKIEQALSPFLKELREHQIYTVLTPVIKTKEEVEFGSLIFLDMIENSKILYDKESFLSNYLQKLKKRLEDLGSKKIKLGNAWYWELVPSLELAREATI